MAAKLRRPSKIENKLLTLDKLQLGDVLCSICQSIIIEPVTLPCFHDFCRVCFDGTIENNALTCPLCRLRIGSWLRTATKQNCLVNLKLWEFIKNRFSKEVTAKLQGIDLNLPQDERLLILSAPGEIRSEYEAELEKHQKERILLENKNAEQSKILIKKMEEEDRSTRQAEMQEQLLRDEILAKQLLQLENKNPRRGVQSSSVTNGAGSSTSAQPGPKFHCQSAVPQQKPKKSTLDKFVIKKSRPVSLCNNSPLMTDDSSGSADSTNIVKSGISTCGDNNANSPELVSTANRYGNFVRDYLDRKFRFFSGNSSDKLMVNSRKMVSTKNLPKTWEPGGSSRDKEKSDSLSDQKEFCSKPSLPHSSNSPIVHSLPVSLPSSILLRRQMGLRGANSVSSVATKTSDLDVPSCSNNRLQGIIDTDSEDSLKQELCYFKPLHSIAGSSRLVTSKPGKVLRIPAVRPVAPTTGHTPSPTNFQSLEYLQGLCQLRTSCHRPLSNASAFVCLIKTINNDKDIVSKKCKQNINGKKCFKSSKPKRASPKSEDSTTADRENNNSNFVDEMKESDVGRESHAGSVDEVRNFEDLCISPKKASLRKLRSHIAAEPAARARRSSPKKGAAESGAERPSGVPADPQLLEERRRLEARLAQEKEDLRLALRIQKDWGRSVERGGYTLRASANKRQVSLLDMMHGAKKMKV